VVDKFVMQLEAQLADRQVSIELTDAARKWLAKKGYDPMFGARPLGRTIQEHIKKALAEELLFGKLAKGGTVKVDLQGEALTFESRSRSRRNPKCRSSRNNDYLSRLRERSRGAAKRPAATPSHGSVAFTRLGLCPRHPLTFRERNPSDTATAP
jgi:hypothetical protein